MALHDCVGGAYNVTRQARIGVKPGQWGWSFEELQSSWQAAEEAGFGIISCFDHVTSSPGRQAAWDAPSLLTAMAGSTGHATLAVDVVNVSLRHPFLLAAQLAVAQAASGGRIQVGLGAGSWHLARFDQQPLGLRFLPLAERCERLARCCEALPALWRGDEVTDPALGLDHASLGPLGITVPPVLVGGTSDATMTIAGPVASRGPGLRDGIQRRGRIGGQPADQPGDHRVRGHRAEQHRLSAQHARIGHAVAAKRHRDRQVSHNLARIVHRPGRPPPA